MAIHLIAEIGVNWTSLPQALDMIREAKKSGCSYVKFQLFNEETIADSPLKESLKPLILGETSINLLKEQAVMQKIGFILTPMYLDAVDLAARYADMIKIRFKDRENQPLLDKAYATGKTLLISVPNRPVNLNQMYNPRIRYFYCVPRYPPDIEDFNIEVASTCEGVSSHFPHTICDLTYAISRFYEESYIEKHVMFETTSIGIQATYADASKEKVGSVEILNHPIDEAVSVTFEKVSDLTKELRLIEKMKRIRL